MHQRYDILAIYAMELQNGSDHKVVANYAGLYEEGEVECVLA